MCTCTMGAHDNSGLPHRSVISHQDPKLREIPFWGVTSCGRKGLQYLQLMRSPRSVPDCAGLWLASCPTFRVSHPSPALGAAVGAKGQKPNLQIPASPDSFPVTKLTPFQNNQGNSRFHACSRFPQSIPLSSYDIRLELPWSPKSHYDIQISGLLEHLALSTCSRQAKIHIGKYVMLVSQIQRISRLVWHAARTPTELPIPRLSREATRDASI
ncbi:hypothetical protein HOY82DRAFT_236299 [Tuber indicum]|nr:hypothetical protein HOY82DRAFT_236299 [Tuber indicum]